jgi:hypothetical protein
LLFRGKRSIFATLKGKETPSIPLLRGRVRGERLEFKG